jgi:hypothetical protein
MDHMFHIMKWRSLKKGNKETTPLVEIDLLTTLEDESKNHSCQGSSEAKVHAETSRYYWN